MPVMMSGSPSPPRDSMSPFVKIQNKFAKDPSSAATKTRHFESIHFSEKPPFAMQTEIDLGLMPPDWTTTSLRFGQDPDPRPLGKSLLDCRFVGSPLGRARGGHNMMQDARGIANAGGTEKALNMDSNFFAEDMADETAAGNESAIKNQYGTNTNLTSFDGPDMMLAQMSQLQKRQMDKDGDGKLSDAELRANGFDTDMRVDQ